MNLMANSKHGIIIGISNMINKNILLSIKYDIAIDMMCSNLREDLRLAAPDVLEPELLEARDLLRRDLVQVPGIPDSPRGERAAALTRTTKNASSRREEHR